MRIFFDVKVDILINRIHKLREMPSKRNRFPYLANRYNIDLEFGDFVSFEVYEYLCYDGTTKLMAYSLTVGHVTVRLR